jgi:hypothetical protein
MSRLSLCVSLAAALALLTLPAGAQAAPLAVDVEDAADHQVSAQGTYKGGLANSWEWRFGSKRSSENITGVVASGMLAAHKLTKLSEHQNSALRAAKALIARYDTRWKQRRPHTQDIEFLAQAGYVIDAGRWFSVLQRRWRAAAYVDYVLSARAAAKSASIVGWDIASALRASIAVGQLGYARGLLTRVIERRRAWDVAKDRQQAGVLSAASLLWALADYKRFSRLTADQRRFAESLQRRVLAAQGKKGGFTTPDGSEYSTQTSAYAVIGLARWGGSKAKRAAARGRTWLRGVAVTDKQYYLGGRMWAAHYTLQNRPSKRYLSEVQSEVLTALATR